MNQRGGGGEADREALLAGRNGEISAALEGADVTDQRLIDTLLREVDGTEDKSRLGANALIGTSLAVCRAAATVLDVPLYRYLAPTAATLPVPFMNCLNGGKLTANNLEIQEFMVIPIGASSYADALHITTLINESLRQLVVEKYGILATNTGDEGGFATPMTGIWEPFEFLQRACDAAGFRAGFDADVVYGADCAASHWYDPNTGLYTLDSKTYCRDSLVELYKKVAGKYPIGSLEVTTPPDFRNTISIGVVEHGGGVAFEGDFDGGQGAVALCGHGLEIA